MYEFELSLQEMCVQRKMYKSYALTVASTSCNLSALQ